MKGEDKLERKIKFICWSSFQPAVVQKSGVPICLTMGPVETKGVSGLARPGHPHIVPCRNLTTDLQRRGSAPAIILGF